MEAAISSGIASATEAVTNVLETNLPEILILFGGLVALGVILRVFKRTVGRKA